MVNWSNYPRVTLRRWHFIIAGGTINAIDSAYETCTPNRQFGYVSTSSSVHCSVRGGRLSRVQTEGFRHPLDGTLDNVPPNGSHFFEVALNGASMADRRLQTWSYLSEWRPTSQGSRALDWPVLISACPKFSSSLTKGQHPCQSTIDSLGNQSKLLGYTDRDVPALMLAIGCRVMRKKPNRKVAGLDILARNMDNSNGPNRTVGHKGVVKRKRRRCEWGPGFIGLCFWIFLFCFVFWCYVV